MGRAYILGALTLIIGITAVLHASLYAAGVTLGESVLYAIDPTPSRAFLYGERHFNSNEPSLYNIDRAEMYFDLAAAAHLDAPYLKHELARIAFLRGDYPTALSLIDAQIKAYGTSTPNSYYIRALIEGFDGNYTGAAHDYATFLTFDPNNWAATNDYAWVLLKEGNATEAARVTGMLLPRFPDNPWLLNTNATALYELGQYEQAYAKVTVAHDAAAQVTVEDWLHAYPGNDPHVAPAGIASLRDAIAANRAAIQAKLSGQQ